MITRVGCSAAGRVSAGRSRSSKHWCTHTGCPASYVTAPALERHVKQPHHPCTCGRTFTLNAIGQHRGQVIRRGIPHPPFDVRIVDRYRIPRAVRRRVYERDGYCCVQCHRPRSRKVRLSLDHVKPVIAGGTDDESNPQTMCRQCNSEKRATEVV